VERRSRPSDSCPRDSVDPPPLASATPGVLCLLGSGEAGVAAGLGEWEGGAGVAEATLRGLAQHRIWALLLAVKMASFCRGRALVRQLSRAYCWPLFSSMWLFEVYCSR